MRKLLILKMIIIYLLVLILPQPATANQQNVSVRLLYFLGNQTEIDVRVNGTYTITENNFQLLEGRNYRFRVEGNQIAIYEAGQKRATYSSGFTASPIVYGEQNYISINSRNYLGDMRFTIESNVIRPINTLPLEDYLKGVVPREMMAAWGNNGGMEALKAQAVTARTYILRRINQVVTDSEHHQVYGGYHWHANTTRAVVETNGEVVRHNGQLVDTFYSSSNGGKILNNRNVWGTTRLPYLQAKEDPFDLKTASLGNNFTNWNFTVHKQQMNLSSLDLARPELWWNSVTEVDQAIMTTVKNWLTNRNHIHSRYESKVVAIPEISFTTQIQLNETLTGRVVIQYILRDRNNNSFVMENGEIKLHSITVNDRHDNIRAMFGSTRMLSPYVKQVEETNTAFRIHGGGWGHNIGMSQYGAYQMSREGFNYRDIIEFYYSGAEIVGGQTVAPAPTPAPTPTPVVQDPIFTMQLTSSRTEMYESPSLSSRRTGSLSPQRVSVFEQRNDWFLIDSWLGKMWINPEGALIGDPETYSTRLFVNENTSIYDSPQSQQSRGAISPQNVATLRKWGEWYEINTWLGPKWIKPRNPLSGGVERVTETIQLTETTRIFASPLDTAHISSLGAQKITATHKWNDWYRVNTWRGPMWIKPQNALIGEPMKHVTRLYVTNTTELFDTPLATKRVSSISPQNITTLRKWGNWYEINTWLGPKWMKPNGVLEGGIDRVNQTISLTKVTQTFDSPLATQSRSSLGVQSVTATHQWNDWYRINTWLGPQWIRPSGTVNASSLNVRTGPGTHFDPPITQLSRGTRVTVLGEVDGWYQIKHTSFTGVGFVSGDFISID